MFPLCSTRRFPGPTPRRSRRGADAADLETGRT